MKTALVLSGGGARGAYEAGVIKALNELGIKCDIVTGVSIGSVNAIAYASNFEDKTIELWKTINFNTVFNINEVPKSNKELRKTYFKSARKGGLEPDNLREFLVKNINIDDFYNSNIDYGLITVKYPKLKEIELTKKDIKKEELIDYVIASCTVFPVFKLKEIENNKYVDGGFKTSVPYTLAKKMGADKCIVINISVLGKRFKPPKDDDYIMIKPRNNIGRPLVFNSEVANKNIKYGYNDTMKTYEKLYGNKYTFIDPYKYYDSKIYKNKKLYINSIERLGRIFNIDDSIIYNIDDYNKLLINKFNNKEFNNKANLDIITTLYNSIKNNKNTNIKPLQKQYRMSYYLYNIKRTD